MTKLVALDVDVSGASVDNKAIDGITLAYSIDSMPTATLGIHEISAAGENNSSVQQKRVFVTEESQKMREFQEAAFAGESEKVTVTINPSGHQYSGSILGPQRTIFSSYYDNGVQLVHDLERINGYMPHIYALSQEVANGVDEFLGATYTNVFEMVKVLLEKRQSEFSAQIDVAAFKDQVSKESVRQIHANNISIFPAIAKICDDSSTFGGATYEAFSKLRSESLLALNTSIFNTLRSQLFNSDLKFLDTLIAIGNTFQSFYVPPIAGDSEFGYFLSNRARVGDSSGSIANIEMVGATFASAQLDNRPIQQVTVTGQPVRVTGANEIGAENIYEFVGDNSTYLVYPEDPSVGNGNNVPLPIPEWIPASIYVYEVQPPTTHSRELNLEKRKAKKSELANKLESKLAGPIADVVKEYAETAYKTLALSSYTAVINATLEFTLVPGKVYDVSDEDFNPLFTGFLTSVTHKISGISSSLSAGSTLVFSSVRFNNFQLP